MNDLGQCRQMLERQSWRLEDAVQEHLGVGDIAPPQPSVQVPSVFSGGEDAPGGPRFRFGAASSSVGPRPGQHVAESIGARYRRLNYPNNLARGDGVDRGDNGGGFAPFR